ncbi:MAG: NUMOD4 domain-containing protein [Thiolinea sp.]
MENQDEIWKDVVGYEGHYKVSSHGNVRSLKRGKNKLLKAKLNHNNYYIVRLYKDSDWKQLRVHRLVAFAFIPNPLNKPQVNHIDGNKRNNFYKNIEWSTNSENQIHAYANGLNVMTEKRKCIATERIIKYTKENNQNRKKVIDISTKIIYNSIKEASTHTGINAGTIQARILKWKKRGTIILYSDYLKSI